MRLALLALLCSCAPTGRDIDRIYIVGGKIAASHFDAMEGVRLSSSDLALPPREDGEHEMFCVRELPTGSHIPRLACRYRADIDRERTATQDFLAEAR